jgi:hypothetical protein
MPNEFSKEEKVAFEQLLEGFNDALVMSRNVNVYNYNQTDAARTTAFPSTVSPNYGTIWRPQPYIMTSVTSTPGSPVSFTDKEQLSVPASITNTKTVAWGLNSVELRDALQEGRLAAGANQKLASDINLSVMQAATSLGSLVVTTATPAGSFDDIALCDSLMNETGVMGDNRYLSLSSRSYNGLAGNVVGTTRSFGAQNRSDKAFERAYVGMVSSFETYKQDYALRKTAYAGGALTVNTLNAGGNVNYVPQAYSTSTAGTPPAGPIRSSAAPASWSATCTSVPSNGRPSVRSRFLFIAKPVSPMTITMPLSILRYMMTGLLPGPLAISRASPNAHSTGHAAWNRT